MIIKSRQDTYQYTHDQKQAGFSADVGFDGKPQSFSINGSKTNVDTDYTQVIQTQDIQNHLNYEGNAISVGIGVADTSNPNGKAKPALQGLGYGTITPAHKTSTTHTAITDQAGLSHINTENFKQAEVQNQLNPIITNGFNQAQALKELNAQVVITTEFSKEAPKAVAKFADKQAFKLIQNLDELNNKNIDITSDEYQNTIKEIDKWSEGGVYRTALHTAMGLLATGTVEGGLSAGTTAYTIPKIDEYLKEQGFDKEVRDTALLALSAGIGATVGDSTASTVNNVGQVQWNYLSHRQLQDKISCVGTKKDCAAHVAKYDEISRQQDEQLKNTCSSNPNSTSCHLMIQDALEYVGKNRNHYGKASDIKTSTQTSIRGN